MPNPETGFIAACKRLIKLRDRIGARLSVLTDDTLAFVGVSAETVNAVLAARHLPAQPLALQKGKDRLGRRWNDVLSPKVKRWDDPPAQMEMDLVEVGEAIAAVERIAQRACEEAGERLSHAAPQRDALTHVFLDGTRLLATDGAVLRVVPLSVPGLPERLAGRWVTVPWSMLLAWAEVWCADEPQGVACSLDETLTLVGTGTQGLDGYSVQLETGIAPYDGLDFTGLLAPVEDDVRPWTWHGRSADVRGAINAATTRAKGLPSVVTLGEVVVRRDPLIDALPEDDDEMVCVRITYPNEPVVVWVPRLGSATIVAPTTMFAKV